MQWKISLQVDLRLMLQKSLSDNEMNLASLILGERPVDKLTYKMIVKEI